MVDIVDIEKRIDRAVTAAIPVNTNLGGLDPKDYGQVMEFAKAMSTARHGIPQWLRGSVGDCLMICTRALRWGMDPYFVADQSYLMVNTRTNESRVGWQSQLIHAVVEALAPIKGRLRHRFEGEDDDTVCIVWATFKGEDQPHEYRSVSLGKRIKDIGRNDKGNFRGSPNWLQKPRVQLFHDASRDWARINCPDVLAGVYTVDELPDMDPVDVSPVSKVDELAKRLRDATAANAPISRGLDLAHVERETAKVTVIEGEVNPDPAKKEEEANADDHGVDQGRRDGGVDSGVQADDQGAGAEGDSGPATAGGPAAGAQEKGADAVQVQAANGNPKGRKGKR